MSIEQISERIASKYWDHPSRVLRITRIIAIVLAVLSVGYGIAFFISVITDVLQTMDKTGLGDNFQSHYGQTLQHGLMTRMKSRIIKLGLVCFFYTITNGYLFYVDRKACAEWDKHVRNIKSSLKIVGLGTASEGEDGNVNVKADESTGFRIEYMVPGTLYSKVVDESDVLNDLKIYFSGDSLSVEQFDDIYTLHDELNNVEKYYRNVSTVENHKKGGIHQIIPSIWGGLRQEKQSTDISNE